MDKFSNYDVYLFKNGSHFKLYEKLGAHLEISEGKSSGTHFAVWAPNAERVSLVGDFNGWNENADIMSVRWDESGIWEIFKAGLGKGSLYKYHIKSKTPDFQKNKSDPFAFFCETSPKTASIIWDLDFEWNDQKWMEQRHNCNSLDKPYSIYEIHPGSWKRDPANPGQFLNYRDIAQLLGDYVIKMGFTHVEIMPVMEHPFYGSWGYQTTGYFAPTSRYGNPQDFMYLVDCLHQNGIGVILDWVPSHFPDDPHGLSFFDGTHLYEHKDPKKGFHPDWKSLIFNYGRQEVKEFLISSAIFWLDKYHIDGLRIDGVASMLYLDYSRKEGQWIPNKYGGRENLEAVEFIKTLNEAVYKEFPDAVTIAEESTAWPMVSRPTYAGGLGFGMKWNMGWMHDTLQYFSKDPIYRKHHYSELTFTFLYAFTENFILPFSHDEVVYGKGSLLNKMPGDRWQKFANLRLLSGYMFAFPGKKLLFMGDELGEHKEWDHMGSLDWNLESDKMNRGLQLLIKDLNAIYKKEAALYSGDFDSNCFEWVDFNDRRNSTLFFLRKAKSQKDETQIKKPGIIDKRELILACFNFTPVPRYGYRIGVPRDGMWHEILNTDAIEYGGSGHGNFGKVMAGKVKSHGSDYSIIITLPPLSAILFKKD
jgi:1,4-alpha-glucan branching enzyme